MTNSTLTLILSPAIDVKSPVVAEILDRISKWQQLFSPESEPYRLTGYEDLYASGPNELLTYDNYAESNSRWLDFERYRQIWEREISQNFPGFVMYQIEVDRIEVSGDLAWTAFTWFGQVSTAAGLVWPAQHATHAWKRINESWCIVHEHLTSGVKENGQAIEAKRSHAIGSSENIIRHSRQPALA